MFCLFQLQWGLVWPLSGPLPGMMKLWGSRDKSSLRVDNLSAYYFSFLLFCSFLIPLGLKQIGCLQAFFFLFFLSSSLRLCATLWVMTDYRYFYVHALGLCPFILSICALSCPHNRFNCEFWVRPSWVYPSNSSPAWLFFCSYASYLFLAPSLPHTSVVINLVIG